MSIKIKNLVFVSVLFIATSAIICIFGKEVLIKNYLKIESDQSRDTIFRTEDIFTTNLDELETISDDWSRWDDTYNFVKDKNQVYVLANLNDTTMENLGLNLMVFVDSNKNIVAFKYHDLNTKQDLAFTKEDQDLLFSEANFNFIDIIETKSGYLNINGMPMLYAASQITPTDQNSSPSNGFLVLGRFAQETMVTNYSKKYNVPVSIYGKNEIESNPVVASIATKLSTGPAYFTDTSDKKTISSYSIFKNDQGKLVFLLKVSEQRELFQKGQKNVYNFFYLIIPLLFILSIYIFAHIYITIIKRLLLLKKNIDDIIDSGDYSASLKESGDDEITDVERSFNHLLDKVGKCKAFKKEDGKGSKY